MSLELEPVGRVESPLDDPGTAPKQGFEGGPEAWITFEPHLRQALEGLSPGQRVIVLTWLDRADRDVLRVHPRDDPRNPLQGVFNTRSADRPNPMACTRSRCGRSKTTGCWSPTSRPLTERPFST